MMDTYIIHLCSHNEHEYKLILSGLVCFRIHTWIVCHSVDVNRERERKLLLSLYLLLINHMFIMHLVCLFV